jgi:hypothetical protein
MSLAKSLAEGQLTTALKKHKLSLLKFTLYVFVFSLMLLLVSTGVNIPIGLHLGVIRICVLFTLISWLSTVVLSSFLSSTSATFFLAAFKH